MARRENTFKKYLMSIMGTLWDAQSHEDMYSEGIPDLSFGAKGVNGWIELKQIAAWPVRPGTPAKPDRYTPQQVNWLMRRNRRGGSCFVMVKVGEGEYFLFAGNMARHVARGLVRSDYYTMCLASWQGSIVPHELLRHLIDKKR